MSTTQRRCPTKASSITSRSRSSRPASIRRPEYVGALITLCQERRGVQVGMTYNGEDRVVLKYELPLAEVVFGFYDRLKSVSRGYASLDYELLEYRRADLIRLDLLVNGDRVDALSIICHRGALVLSGRDVCVKMKDLIPPQRFEVAIKVPSGTASSPVPRSRPCAKNVTAKCYGGDISRKRKLLERQKEGKKRMKQIGSVEIPQEAFLAVLRWTKMSEEEKAKGQRWLCHRAASASVAAGGSRSPVGFGSAAFARSVSACRSLYKPHRPDGSAAASADRPACDCAGHPVGAVRHSLSDVPADHRPDPR